MFQECVFRLADVRYFIGRHAQFIMRAIAIQLQLAGAHADHVRTQRHRQDQGQERVSHPSASSRRVLRSLTKITRRVASTGMEKNIPTMPAICSPASTPNKTS